MGKRINRLFWVLALAFGLRACFLEPVRMTDGSMTPVLLDGDVALVSKFYYGLRVPGAGSILAEWKSPQKGDLVVAVSVGDPPVSLLRRISGVPGDKVKSPEGKELELQEGEFYIAADQVEGLDSRKLGIISRKSIIGKATYVWLAQRPSTEVSSGVDSPKVERRMLQPL